MFIIADFQVFLFLVFVFIVEFFAWIIDVTVVIVVARNMGTVISKDLGILPFLTGSVDARNFRLVIGKPVQLTFKIY